MKNLNILGIHCKIGLLGEGGSQKPIQRVRLPKKWGLGHFVDLRGRLGKKEQDSDFEGEVHTPMHTMIDQKQVKIFLWHYYRQSTIVFGCRFSKSFLIFCTVFGMFIPVVLSQTLTACHSMHKVIWLRHKSLREELPGRTG